MVDRPTQRFVCLGKTISQDDRLCVKLAPVTDSLNGKFGEYGIYEFKSSLSKLIYPGGMYDIYYEKDESSGYRLFGRPIYHKMWPNQEEVLAWRAESDKNEALFRKSKNALKDKNIDSALEALKPLQEIYDKTDRLGRLGLEVAVLSYLRRYRGE